MIGNLISCFLQGIKRLGGTYRKDKEGAMKKIAFYEPWFFLLFGVFHLHRIWGMIDRKSYADFWIGILESRNAFYYVLMIILGMFCLLGLISFFKNIRHNYWWRWIYVAGGIADKCCYEV